MKLEETSYLLKNQKNESRLMEAIEDYKKGLAQERTLFNAEVEPSDSLTQEDYRQQFKKHANRSGDK